MDDQIKISVKSANFFYGSQQALHEVNISIRRRFVTALIGPSGCGTSTFLRALNRMNDLIPGTRLEGRVELDGQDVYSSSMDVIQLRRRVGMIFQRSNPFPMSIYENVAYGPRVTSSSFSSRRTSWSGSSSSRTGGAPSMPTAWPVPAVTSLIRQGPSMHSLPTFARPG